MIDMGFFRVRKKRGVTLCWHCEPSVEYHATAPAQNHCRIKSRTTLVICVSASSGYLRRDRGSESKMYLLRDREVRSKLCFDFAIQIMKTRFKLCFGFEMQTIVFFFLSQRSNNH